MSRTKGEKMQDDKRFLRFRKAVEGAIDNEGYMPPEWSGDPLILRLMLMTKELAVLRRKSSHRCHDYICSKCENG
jgi:hypothetical protein